MAMIDVGPLLLTELPPAGLAISDRPCKVERMVETVATFLESLTEEETLELTRELDSRREKIDLLQERAFARLAELRGTPAGAPAA
jgi:hypothetical protein